MARFGSTFINGAAHRGDERRGRKRRSHDVAHAVTSGPISASRGMSGPPAIDIGMEHQPDRMRFAKRHRRRVRDDADDRPPGWSRQLGVRRERANAPPDGVLAREVRIGDRLVHDDVGFAAIDVGAGEAAPAQQRRAHDVGVAAGDGAECDKRRWVWSGRPLRPPRSARCRNRERQRQTGGGRCAGDAGNR